MNRSALIATIVVIILIVAGVALYAANNRNDSTTASNTNTTQNLNATPSNEDAMMHEGDEAMAPANDNTGTNANTIQTKSFTITGSNFKFSPSTITVSKGDNVSITFANSGGNHNFVIDEYNIKTDILDSGQSTTVNFTADKAGSFEFYCGVGTHRQMGMKGTLIVK